MAGLMKSNHISMRMISVCAVILLSAAMPWVASGGAVVTNSTELLRYLGYGGKAGIRFDIDATVIWGTTINSKTFYAKTSDGYVRLADKKLWPNKFLNNGDVIKASGRTVCMSNGFSNADCFSIEIISRSTPEQIADVSIKDVLSGRYPFRPVRVKGTVRDTFADEIDHKYRHVILSADSESIGLSIPSDKNTEPLSHLIGAKIRATGCYTPLFSGYRKLSRCEINLGSTNAIEILKPPPADRFSAPSIDSIRLEETASILKLGRHIAKGIVIAVWQRGDFAVRTDNGSIVNVRLAEGSPPSYGDRVEVVGLPDTDLYRINLRRAIWRKIPGGGHTPAKATLTEAATLFTDGKGHNELKPDFHGQAISLQGTVFGSHSDIMDNGIVRLLCNGFSVTIDSSASPSTIAALQPGCKARISGTYIVKTDSWHPNEPLPRIQEVILVVRDASDIEILEPPPWWTPQRFAILISALFATLMAFLLWNVLLRRLAEKRGRELMQSKLSQVESQLKVQERTRIAVELHDTIAQNLTGVSLEIDSAEQLATKNLEGMMQHLGMAARTLQSCRNELRNCLWDLRSRALEEANLNEAIRRAIAPQISNVELSIRFNVERKHLTDDTAHVLMRIIRELVLNAVRHGEASSVKIAGSLENGDTLLFSVSDNGCGFDPQTRPGVAQGHFGLQGVRERVNQFDGEMNIESAPGKGSRISILMKLSDQT